MKLSNFYERYWQNPGASPSDEGFDTARRKELLRKALRQFPAGSPVLDAGCGNGDFSNFLAGLGYQVTGVDVSGTVTRRNRYTYPHIRFSVASLDEGLPFDHESFAAAWSSEVMEHLFDIHTALAELNRVLQPGGVLVLTTPYHGLVKNIVIALSRFDHHYNPYLSHIRFFSRRTLAYCLERAGFTVKKSTGVGRFYPMWRSSFVVARKTGLPLAAPEIEG